MRTVWNITHVVTEFHICKEIPHNSVFFSIFFIPFDGSSREMNIKQGVTIDQVCGQKFFPLPSALDLEFSQGGRGGIGPGIRAFSKWVHWILRVGGGSHFTFWCSNYYYWIWLSQNNGLNVNHFQSGLISQ